MAQPTQAGTYATNVSYFPNGAMAGFTYGNGIVHTLTRNARGLPEESKDAYGSTRFLDDVYDYDEVGNVAAITDGATGQGQRGNRTMTYDGLDRLTDAVSPMYGTTGTHYTYDVLDNLVHTIAPGRDQWLCYDQFNRLTNVMTGGDCTTGNTILGLGYDAQGNLNNWNGKVHNFDYGNRLRSVTDVESYRYDAHGRRIRAWTPSAGLLYSLYSQAGQLLWQRDSRSSRRREYVYLNGSLVAERTRPISGSTETITYQHTDALGTPVLKTSASRVILERREYEPYGKLLNIPLESGPGFTGHDTDPDTQYTYMQQRYYDPRVGRFWSVDPVTVDSVGGNFNRYWYANNNPYRFTDPDGRQSVGEMIDTGAEGCGTVSCAGWAALKAGWEVFGFEGVSQVADKGTASGKTNGAMAILEVVTLGKGKVVSAPLRSALKGDALLIRAAESAGKSVQKSLDTLVRQLAKGNMNPGIGTKHLFSGIFEARARDGARVYFRSTENGIEVVGKSDKSNQEKVIRRLQEKYAQ